MKIVTAIILILTISACSTTSYRGSAIRDRLADTPELASHNISIEEEPAGNITLNGNVASSKDRDTIEKVARNTSGVKQLRSNLVIDQSSVAVREGYSASKSDFQISQDVREALSNRSEIDLRNVEVTTRDSIVTLRGRQNSNTDIDNLIFITERVSGVRGVRNELSLSHRSYQ